MTTSDPEHLELSRLRDEVRALEQAYEERLRAGRELLYTEQRLRAIMDATQNGVAITERGAIVEVNDRLAAMLGYTPDELIGMSPRDLNPPEEAERALQRIRAGDESAAEWVFKRKDGSLFDAEVWGRAILYQGRPARVSTIRDITERKQAEEAARAAAVQREVLRAHEALLSALSTPLLPITKEILVLPLVGALTPERADQVIKTLVEGVAQHRTTTAILDITGVHDVDARVADMLLQAARAARLLGARVVLTGIRPEVAQRFVLLGVDLGELVTYGTLQQGVTAELAQRGSAQQRKPTS